MKVYCKECSYYRVNWVGGMVGDSGIPCESCESPQFKRSVETYKEKKLVQIYLEPSIANKDNECKWYKGKEVV